MNTVAINSAKLNTANLNTAQKCRLVYVKGHVEAFDQYGKFILSADNKTEAIKELEENE